LLRFASNTIEKAGTVTLRTRSVENTVEIELTDTGRGLTPEEVDRLFDFSFSRQGSRVGANAGLSIVRDIIERHGGTIKARSEVGKGTTVTVKVPFFLG
jgi:signal transduction histidine kinase